MTKQEIITKFELYFDDQTSLSTQEESDLFDKKYNEICFDRPWEFLKTPFAGNLSISVPYITLPQNFSYMIENGNYSDDTHYSQGPVVFVGPSYRPYKVVSYSDRRQYRDQDGYCYVNIGTGQLVFTKQPVSAEAIEYDYISFPTALTLPDSPIFPDRFHDMIYHAMQIDQIMIEQSDKAKSYAKENEAMYKSFFNAMASWNARLIQMN